MNQFNERVHEILEKTGLNWSVRKEPIQTVSGLAIEDAYAIVREDTNVAFPKTFADSYQPYQNHEMIELLDKVSGETGLQIHKGGSFKGGRRVYVQLKSDDLILGGDKVEGYLTGINSFDGSTSLAFGPSNITISCMNTFFAAFKEMNTKIRHTKNMSIKIDEITRYLLSVKQQEQIVFDDIKRLSEFSITQNNIDDVLKSLFDLEVASTYQSDEAVSARKRNQIDQFHLDLRRELNQKGENAWGLFSGVTRYTTHSVSDKDTTEIKMFNGSYGQKDKMIFQQLVELV
jgi:phage/plasmid-like protein (TIGR03299 family)